MKPMNASHLALCACVLVCHAGAGPVLTTSVTGSGSPRTTATGVIADMVADPSGGTAATSSSYTLKPGFAGQLYDQVELNASAQPADIDEGTTTQLSATAVMDDATSLQLAAGEVTWSVLSGPITSISVSGVATGGVVAGNRSATARVQVPGFAEDVSITVLDSNRDNFGPVAGDGIDDVWQFLHFDADENDELDSGEAQAAAPDANPDHDIHDNFFEWASGHDPNDASSFLRFRILSKTGTDARFSISRAITGTTYAVERMDDLQAAAFKVDVAGFTAAEDASDVELTDPAAATLSGFYRLRLEREP